MEHKKGKTMFFEEKTDHEVRELAKDCKIETKGMTANQIRDALEVHAIKRQEELTARARAERTAELDKKSGADPVTKRKPSPETVGIEGGIHPLTGKEIPPSKKGYYIFTNIEDPECDVGTNPGGKYTWRFYPNRLHLACEWIVEHCRLKARTPIYAEVENPQTGNTESRMVSSKARFAFDKVADAPQDGKFGVVTDAGLLAKYMKPILTGD